MVNASQTIIHGTALDQNNGNALAADIDLVVYGVARNITSIQVSKWIEDQGVKVSDCVTHKIRACADSFFQSRKNHLCGHIEYAFVHIEIILEKDRL